MYAVRIARPAERRLRRIRQGDPGAYVRIADRIRRLAEDPRPSDAVKLRGYKPPAWRLRVADYRIIYEVYEERIEVIVINVAPRGEVYR